MRFLKISLLGLLFIVPCLLPAQEVYFNTANMLYKADLSTGDRTLISTSFVTFFDIAFHPDGTLYGLSDSGGIFEIDSGNGELDFFMSLPSDTLNSFTIDSEGLFYVAGASLFTYDIETEVIEDYGSLGFIAGGDLLFWEEELYITTLNDELVRIDRNDFSNNEVVAEGLVPGFLTGITVNYTNCDDGEVYVVNGAFEEGDLSISTFYRVDFNQGIFVPDFTISNNILGCAALFESAGSSTLAIDDVTIIFPNCDLLGTITVNASGGAGELSYLRWNQPFQTSNQFADLPLGTYEIFVTDELGCQERVEVEVFGVPSPILNDVVGNIIGCDTSEAFISIDGEGDGPLGYSIDGGLTYQGSPDFIAPGAGSYDVRIQDINGCVRFQRLDISTGLPVIDSVDYIIGCNDVESDVEIFASGGNGTLNYSVDGIVYGPENLFTGLLPDVYRFFTRDSSGCIDSTRGLLALLPVMKIDSVAVLETRCGDDNGEIAVFVEGGIAPFEWQFSGPATTTGEGAYFDLTAGDYEVSVTDQSGCEIVVDGLLVRNSEVIELEGVKILPVSCGDIGGEAEAILPEGVFLDNAILNGDTMGMVQTYTNLIAGGYLLEVVTDEGCLLETSFNLRPSNCNIYLPTAFSPNADGINDVFSLFPDVFADGLIGNVTIFDRWGGEVLRVEDIALSPESKLWDGKYRGKQAMPGVYVYSITVELDNGLTTTYEGSVNLVR
jgi:gliding motility-associated-like protein